MDEIWKRAVETALDGLTDHASARTLTLDGAVKCIQGRLPPPSLLEKFENLQHLSIANVGVSSLEQFPRLRNLQKLNLSDNRIAGGLESLVRSCLDLLRDLDLSNNRIQFIEDLAPLAQLKLVSLDLYECPVTRVKDYRSRVFGLIKSLKYLDKMDAEGNERPESDDEEEDEDEEEEDDDPGSGEVDGEEQSNGKITSNGHSEGVVELDEDEASDADVEEVEAHPGVVNGRTCQNGFDGEEGEDDDDEDEEEDYNESGEEIDDEDVDEDDVVEVHEVEDDSSDEDGDEDDEQEDDGEDEDEEEVDNVDGDNAETPSNGRILSLEGEINGHERGEDHDDNRETGEEEQGIEDDGEFDEEDEDSDAGYLVQPVGQAEVHDVDGSDMEQGDEEDEPGVDEDDEVQVLPSSSQLKRKRDDKKSDENGDAHDEEEEDDDDDPNCSDSPAKKKHQ